MVEMGHAFDTWRGEGMWEDRLHYFMHGIVLKPSLATCMHSKLLLVEFLLSQNHFSDMYALEVVCDDFEIYGCQAMPLRESLVKHMCT